MYPCVDVGLSKQGLAYAQASKGKKAVLFVEAQAHNPSA